MKLYIALILLAVASSFAARAADLPLRFWDASDIEDPFGKIVFGAESLENEGKATGYPDMQYGCAVPRDDGAAWIYGWRMRNWEDREHRVIQVVRCVTRDGRTFESEEVLFEHERAEWQGFASIVHRPTDGALFLFSWAEWPGKLHVFRSDDGATWSLISDNALQGHDASGFFWHGPSGKLINIQTIVQPYPKRYPDNIGERRRVLSFLRSGDGVTWESFTPEFLGGATLWTPDAHDPADLEFYRAVVFPLQGRWAAIINDYVPPPSEANSRRALTKHGPPYLCEWAISRDGIEWDRNFRDTNVIEHQFWLTVQGPFFREGRFRFYKPDGSIAGLPEDRVFYVTCRANGEFSTPAFTMPDPGLTLNAYAGYRPAEGATGQAYIMAELQDESGATIPGYEREKCLYENTEGGALTMAWEGKSGRDLAGQSVRLRFFLRDAKIYGVSAGL